MSLIALLLAAAQHDHGQHTAPPPAPVCSAEHAAMGHCDMPKEEAPPPPPAPPCPPEHAAMGHCAAAGPAPSSDPEPSAGNTPPPPAPRVGAADAIYGADAMAPARARLYAEHGGGTVSKIMIDQAEIRVANGKDSYVWDAEGWYGGDIDKLVVKSEGEGEFGGALDTGEAQALWGHAIGPYFDLQAGVRQDFGPGASPTYAVIGFEGLAPYWFDIEGALFVSHKGDVTARFEGSYDQRITQRLILQPWTELGFALQDVPEQGVGAGLSTVELGVRLRYEIEREFAPYVGFVWERKVGQTARFARAAGEDASRPAVVAGLRVWF